MIKFDLEARIGSTFANGLAEQVCKELENSLFPLSFEMVCKSSKNNFQLSSLFDEAFIKQTSRLGFQPIEIELPELIKKQYDAAVQTSHGVIVFEVEKANWEKFLYDLLKAHIYLRHGADFCCIMLPHNWAHQHGEIDVYQESKVRFELARQYRHCSPDVLDRLLLIGFRQYWKGGVLNQQSREQMRNECRRHFNGT